MAAFVAVFLPGSRYGVLRCTEYGRPGGRNMENHYVVFVAQVLFVCLDRQLQGMMGKRRQYSNGVGETASDPDLDA